ncbi:MAG: FMN-binding negative transcriptional regulator, partial [Propionibacteriaceae bacterium]|nr:FMN-binding negative transcriptional regulator [Propionibacteriaceae bacterium]
MHIQNHFRMSDDEAARLLANPGACDVVAWGGESLEASYLPMCFQPGGEHGSLTTHIAKINPLAAMDGAPAVAMVHGADAFIASAWLSDGEDVEAPGWNYLVLAAYGR